MRGYQGAFVMQPMEQSVHRLHTAWSKSTTEALPSGTATASQVSLTCSTIATATIKARFDLYTNSVGGPWPWPQDFSLLYYPCVS